MSGTGAAPPVAATGRGLISFSLNCDSRLNPREAAAVGTWLASGRRFHVMHDHPDHASWPMLGGMWGVRGGVVPDASVTVTVPGTHPAPFPPHAPWHGFVGEIVRADR